MPGRIPATAGASVDDALGTRQPVPVHTLSDDRSARHRRADRLRSQVVRARSIPAESERALDLLFGAYSYRRTGAPEYALVVARRQLHSADLEIGIALALEGRSRRDARGDKPDVFVRAGFRRIDLEGRECDLAQIDLQPVLRQRRRTRDELWVDHLHRPGRVGQIVQEELDARGMRHDHELECARIVVVDRKMIVDVAQLLGKARVIAEIAMIQACRGGILFHLPKAQRGGRRRSRQVCHADGGPSRDNPRDGASSVDLAHRLIPPSSLNSGTGPPAPQTLQLVSEIDVPGCDRATSKERLIDCSGGATPYCASDASSSRAFSYQRLASARSGFTP